MNGSYKQEIEEMAKILCGFEVSCEICKLFKYCHTYNLATAFYNAGCRKVIEESGGDVPQSS